ncbi:uncharacterized protein LOC120334932 [Styela clava]|uniref:uncharacterized protein LOC120334932 n=1 Tax=Styela clava TaxID=7725 RepID=UPI00193AAF59|nr:uncharacterized protein LOC120334932 [Styela clava]XP_039258384.1 uncharacterized protein LOC120334932 [Styela clava]
MGCGGSKSVNIRQQNEPPYKRRSVKRDEENGEHLPETKQSDVQIEEKNNNLNQNRNSNKTIENVYETAQELKTQKFTINGQLDLSSIFRIIKQAVYVADLQQLTLQKAQNLELEDRLRYARSNIENPPPISEEEAASDNPRRYLPPRNDGREKAWVLSTEVDIVFDIFIKGQYVKNLEILSKLQEEFKDIENRLREISILKSGEA